MTNYGYVSARVMQLIMLIDKQDVRDELLDLLEPLLRVDQCASEYEWLQWFFLIVAKEAHRDAIDNMIELFERNTNLKVPEVFRSDDNNG